VHVDPVQGRTRRASGPSGHQRRDFVPLPGEAPEDLVQMLLGATRERVLTIEPVDDQDAQGCLP
jgi:hypothetical protein